MPEGEFNALEDRVERLARDSASTPTARAGHIRKQVMFDPAHREQDFIELVRQAIDDLPPEFAHPLDHVGVVVSDQGEVQRIGGRRQRLYGLYIGYGSCNFYRISRPMSWALPDHIVIFRDTLVRDYGHDPNRLQAAITRTLRHALAHHLGCDEDGVRALGL
jgi:predicted Zn-dependent protease with MMP-like domain